MEIPLSILQGNSLFTSFATFDGKAPFFDLHCKRLLLSVGETYLANKFHFETLYDYFLKEVNWEYEFQEKPNHYFRLTIYPELSHTREVLISDLKMIYHSHERGEKKDSISLLTVESPYSETFKALKAGSYFQIKYLQYSHLKKEEEDILLISKNKILEASTSCVVFQKENTFYTPKNSQILESITLKGFVKFCLEFNLVLEFKELELDSIHSFDHAFVLNSVSLMRGVSRIDVHKYTENKELIKSFNHYYKRIG